jgi:multidrug efflux pump subunit AcrB
MLLLCAGGLLSLMSLKRELFAQFSLDTVSISVPYLGASPEEVEQAVLIRIEEAIQGVDGIKEVRSTALEGLGNVSVQVEKGYDVRKVKERLKSRVDAITTFPAETERPVVEEVLVERDTIWLAIYGDASERALKEYARRVRDDLVDLPGISQVELIGVRDYEISVEASEHALMRHGLRLQDLSDAIREASLDLPGGVIRSAEGEIQVRMKEQDYVGADFEAIVIRQSADGAVLRLGDVAQVRDAFVDQPFSTRCNGKPAALLKVKEVGRENPLEISKKVYRYAEHGVKSWLPEGVHVEAWGDSSFYLEGRLKLLIQNGAVGFVLVLLTLALFLRPSLAFFVAIGIPVSFLGTFMVAPFIGISINLISLFAFILVLGIVVDDAIVISESVFTEFQERGPGVDAAISGTHKVSVPVLYAVLTTMVAFIPVFFLPGLVGKFFMSIPMVVIPTLAISLLQSKLVLPYHLSLCKVGDRSGRAHLGYFSRMQRVFSDRLESFIRDSYGPWIQRALKRRYLIISLFSAVFILSIGMVFGGWIRFVQFPNVPSDFIMVDLAMAEGTSHERTASIIDRIEQALLEVSAEEKARTGMDPVKYRACYAGYSINSDGMAASSQSGGSHLGAVIVELAKSEIREATAFEVADAWREKVGVIPGVRRLVFKASAAGPVGLPVNIRLTGRDFDQIRAASKVVQEHLGEFAGLFDIRDTFSEGKQEVILKMKPDAEALGVHAAEVAQQVRSAFYGGQAQRIQRGRDDLRVMVRHAEGERRSLHDLEAMHFLTRDGRAIPMDTLAVFSLANGMPTISRVDGKRVVQILADADKAVANPTDINRELYGKLLPEWLKPFPDVVPVKDGEAKDFEELVPVLLGGMLMVLLLIYALLAVPFRSYLQPMIVLVVVPFGISGALLGHWITGQDLSVLSFLGIIALAGVVVNDSLVLVDWMNQARREGVPLHDAVWRGGVARFRAILLTSLTTFAGLTPILMERSLQAQFLIPMATSLSFGVLFGTAITLIMVPCVYLMLEDLQAIFSRLSGRPVV